MANEKTEVKAEPGKRVKLRHRIPDFQPHATCRILGKAAGLAEDVVWSPENGQVQEVSAEIAKRLLLRTEAIFSADNNMRRDEKAFEIVEG